MVDFGTNPCLWERRIFFEVTGGLLDLADNFSVKSDSPFDGGGSILNNARRASEQPARYDDMLFERTFMSESGPDVNLHLINPSHEVSEKSKVSMVEE